MGTPEQKLKIILDPYEICFSFKNYKELLSYNTKYIDKINVNYTKIKPYFKNNSFSSKKRSSYLF